VNDRANLLVPDPLAVLLVIAAPTPLSSARTPRNSGGATAIFSAFLHGPASQVAFDVRYLDPPPLFIPWKVWRDRPRGTNMIGEA
jgi:hypothetical protein